MKASIQRLVLCMVVLLLLSNMALAGATKEVSLQQAVNLALEKSLDVKISDLNLKNAQIDFQRNQANNLLTASRSLALQAELNLAQAKDNNVQTKNTILMNITRDYLQLVQKQLEINLYTKQMELEKRVRNDMQAQVKLGHVGQLDFLRQENKYQNAIFNLEKIKDDYTQLQRKLKTTIGVQPTEELKLLPFTVKKVWAITEDEALKVATANSFTIEARQRQIELAQVDLDKATAKATPELDLERLRNDLELAKLNYEKAKEDLYSSVQNQFYLYQQSVKKLELSKQAYTQAETNYQIVKKQRETGLKTENDLLSAELSLLQEDLNEEVAQLNYLTNLLQLQKVMGIQIEVKTSEIFN